MKTLRHHRLFISVGFAVAAHLCLLYISFEEPGSPEPRPLQVTLKVAPTPPPPEQVVEPEQVEEPRPDTDSDPETIEVNPNTEAEQAVVKNEEARVGPEPENPNEQPTFDRRTLVSQTKSLLNQTKPTFQSFSSKDFPSNQPAAVPNTKRPGELPLLLSAGFASSSQSATGQSTDLIRGANGEAMCWQQRGIPGETQRWYRVPLALCGHLNKP